MRLLPWLQDHVSPLQSTLWHHWTLVDSHNLWGLVQRHMPEAQDLSDGHVAVQFAVMYGESALTPLPSPPYCMPHPNSPGL
jgi:hypothetical protein